MKIILRKSVDNVGNRGDTVDVKSGFARNYLIPKGLAFPFSPGNLKRFEEEKRNHSIQESKNIEEANTNKKQLEEESITIKQKAHDNDELYGSVNAQLIAENIRESGYELDKSAVILDDPIKKLGVYDIEVKLHPEVTAVVKVWVVKDE